MSRLGTFVISGVEYDLDDLTLDEVEMLEEKAGSVLSEINYAAAKSLKAIAYVFMLRSNPELTWEEIGKVKVLDFVQPDEEMPALPPRGAGEESESSDSAPGDSGVPASVVSITG